MYGLARMNVLKKPQLSYVIEIWYRKRRILEFFPPAEKAFIFQLISQNTSIGTRKK